MAQAQRRLAAIMFADLASYTRRTKENEQLAIEVAKNLRTRLDQLAREFQGKLIKSMGDGFLIEFQSSLEAVNFAVAAQKHLHEASWDELAQKCPPLKIGIHMGDVEHVNGDVYGDTVNVASKVEPRAGSHGGICITEPVFEDVRGKITVRVHRIGELELKSKIIVNLYRVHLPWHHEFVIMVTSSEEFDAIKSEFQLSEPHTIGGTDYYSAVVPALSGAIQHMVACIRFTNPGNLGSKSATQRVVDDIHPSFILLVGTGGGIQGRWNIALGDVVVSRAVSYDSKKQVSKTTDMYWGNLQPPSRTLRDSFHRIEAKKLEWWRPLGPKPDGNPSSPKAIEADFISGETLRADPASEDLRFLIDRFPEAVCYEMEAAGVANALWEQAEGKRKPGYLVVKGVTDYVNANPEENQADRNRWRLYASKAAAELAHAIISYTEF